MSGHDRDVERHGHVRGFREEIKAAAARSRDAFLTWFDAARDPDEAFVRGAWDFSVHIAIPLAPHLERPETKTVLEIGHGAGRLIAAAARHFGKAIGVDVHDCNDLVGAELAGRGVSNVILSQGNGRTLPVPDAHVDVVYTFIVMQHVEHIDVFDGYIHEIHRVLKPGGIAVVYFGRWSKLSLSTPSSLLFLIDCCVERLAMPHGYREIAAAVNDTNLLITRSFGAALARRAGLTVLGAVASRKRVPDGVSLYGGQHGLVLQKP